MALSAGQKKQRRKLASMGRAPGLKGDKTKAQKMYYARQQKTMAAGLGKTGQSLDSQKLGAEATRLTGIPSQPKEGSFNISDKGAATALANRKEARQKAMFSPTRLDTRSLYSMDKSPFTGLKGIEGFKNVGYRPPVFKSAKQMRFGIPYTDPGRTGSLANFGNWFDKGVNKRIPNEATASFVDAFKDDYSQMGKFKNLKTGNLEKGLLGTSFPKNFRQLKQTFNFGEDGGGFGFSFGKGRDTGPTGIQRMLVRRVLPYVGQIDLGRDLFTAGGDEGFVKGINAIGNINDAIPFNPAKSQVDLNTDLAFKASNAIGLTDFTDRLMGGLNISDTRSASNEPTIKTESNPLGRTLPSIGAGLADKFTGNFFDFDNLGGQTEEGKQIMGIFKDSRDIINALKPNEVKKFADFRVNADEQAALNKANAPLNKAQLIKAGLTDAQKLLNSNLSVDDVSSIVGNAKSLVTADGKAKAWNDMTIGEKKQLTNATNAIINNSALFQNFGEQYTGASDFKDQTQSTLKAINKTLQESSADTDGRVDAINNTLKNINKIDGYQTVSRFLNQLATNKNLSLRGKIQNAFNKDSAPVKALSFKDRGFTGSGGNAILGGKISDIFKENNQANMGKTLSPTDIGNLIANASLNYQTPGSVTRNQVDAIQNILAPGTVTTPSLIREVLPKFPTQRGGSGGGVQRGTAAPRGGSDQELIEEFLRNQVPTELAAATPQAGTDAGNLAQMQQQAYLNTLGGFGYTPNYFAQVQPRAISRPMPRRSYFDRDYFAQFA